MIRATVATFCNSSLNFEITPQYTACFFNRQTEDCCATGIMSLYINYVLRSTASIAAIRNTLYRMIKCVNISCLGRRLQDWMLEDEE